VTTPAILASAVLLLLAAGAAVARRRLARATGGDGPVVSGRVLLSRDAGIAVVRAGSESVLVGWGRDGVRLIARLGSGRPA
jgi:hypothetical protein